MKLIQEVKNPDILTFETRFDFILHVLNNSVKTIFFLNVFQPKIYERN